MLPAFSYNHPHQLSGQAVGQGDGNLYCLQTVKLQYPPGQIVDRRWPGLQWTLDNYGLGTHFMRPSLLLVSQSHWLHCRHKTQSRTLPIDGTNSTLVFKKNTKAKVWALNHKLLLNLSQQENRRCIILSPSKLHIFPSLIEIFFFIFLQLNGTQAVEEKNIHRK